MREESETLACNVAKEKYAARGLTLVSSIFKDGYVVFSVVRCFCQPTDVLLIFISLQAKDASQGETEMPAIGKVVFLGK